MGYEVSCSGSIRLKDSRFAEAVKRVGEWHDVHGEDSGCYLLSDWDTRTDKKGVTTIYVGGYDTQYHGDDFKAFINAIIPYVDYANFDCESEDHEFYRFEIKDGEFNHYPGYIAYDASKVKKLESHEAVLSEENWMAHLRFDQNAAGKWYLYDVESGVYVKAPESLYAKLESTPSTRYKDVTKEFPEWAKDKSLWYCDERFTVCHPENPELNNTPSL